MTTREPIAYLNTEYPSLSHTFIEREIRVLRERGLEIHTFSVRRANNAGRLDPRHREEAERTVNLLGSLPALLGDCAKAALRSPAGVLRAIAVSGRLGEPGLAARLRRLVYVAEGLRLAQQMRARNLRHVHVHMANNGAAVAQLATKYDPSLEYSLSIHGSAEFFHVDSWALKQKVEPARFTRCISNFCKAQVMLWTDPETWDRFDIVHCGVDLDAYTLPDRSGAFDGPGRRLRLLTVGRLHAVKGYLLLLEAIDQAVRRGVDCELEMVGDGPARAQIESMIQRLGLAERVRLAGAVGQDAIQAHYERADVMAVSSFMEGVPVVLMEAMAKGMAVISTRVGGVPELVEDGASGVLVDPGSAAAIADAIERLWSRRAELAEMGRVGRRAVEDGFSTRTLGDEMAEVFDRRLFSPDRASHAR